jgi:hypothetical protein
MAKQLVNIGAAANDKTGTPLRDAFDMINDNFNELYAEPSLSLLGNTLTLTKPDATTDTVDLAPYLDEDARAISSGTLNGATGIVTFTRDDATTFTLDLSGLLDDTNTVTSVNGEVGIVVLDTDDIAQGATNLYNQTHTGDVTGSLALTIEPLAVTTGKIADDAVEYSKLGAEFTEAAVISASDVDFSSAQVFTKTLTGATTLTFSSVQTGMVKDLVIIGNFPLSLPASVKTISGTYDGTKSNLIQIVSTNGSTEQWATISQEA